MSPSELEAFTKVRNAAGFPDENLAINELQAAHLISDQVLNATDIAGADIARAIDFFTRLEKRQQAELLI